MINYEEDWLFWLIFKCQGSVYSRTLIFAVPSMCMSFGLLFVEKWWFPTYREDLGLTLWDNSVVWSAFTATLLFMVGFRTRQGLQRFWEGTGLLHQMKGEWFDTVSNCVTFTISSGKQSNGRQKEVESFRHTIVRLMSLAHGSALEEISGMTGTIETIDVMGLNNGTLKHLKDCVEKHHFNKVEVLLHLVQSLITEAHESGIIQIPPPILSRVYQTISRGYVNLLNTKKITDTKFPFPYVQVITVLLFAQVCLAPIAVTSVVNSMFWAPVLTFLPVYGAFALNFIAIELEDPFGEDANDLPLHHFQAEMNNCLLMLLHPNSDLIAGVGSSVVTDFEVLKRTVSPCKSLRSSTIKTACTWDPDDEEDEGSRNSSRRNSLSLFDPAVKIIGSEEDVISEAEFREASKDPSTVEVAAPATVKEVKDSFALPQKSVKDNSKQLVAASVVASAVVTPVDILVVEGQTGTVSPRQAERMFAESKLQPKDVEILLLKSMEDFKKSLQNWTQTMEDQVRDLNASFSHLGERPSQRNSRNSAGSSTRPEDHVHEDVEIFTIPNREDMQITEPQHRTEPTEMGGLAENGSAPRVGRLGASKPLAKPSALSLPGARRGAASASSGTASALTPRPDQCPPSMEVTTLQKTPPPSRFPSAN